MNKTALNILVSALILIPAQAVFFNNMVLFNVAVPLVFIYIIISLPITYTSIAATTIGFVSGLAVDILSDTPGLNALCCTILAFLQHGVFHLYVSSDIDLAEQRPSPRNMGVAAYMKYVITMVVIYCLLVFGIEALQVFNLRILILRVIFSTIYSFIIIYAIAGFTVTSREKRL